MPIRLAKFFATFFYVGYFPKAPGSLATLLGYFLCFFLRNNLFLYILTFVIITVIGFWASDRMEKASGEKDPSCIVIDEVSGVMIAFFLLPVQYLPVAWTTFFLFRAFDMFKIYPVYKLEPLKGGIGVMMDDVIAGLYTCLVMHIALRLSGGV